MSKQKKRPSSGAPTPGECFQGAAAGEERRAQRGATDPVAEGLWANPSGRNPSDTYVQTLHRVGLKSRPECLVSGGVDYQEWTALVAFDPLWFGHLIPQLNEVKLRCQKEQKADEWTSLLGCADVRVHRSGLTRGGGRGTHFPFLISYSGIQLGIGDWNGTDRTHHNLYVRLKGRDCLLLGAWEAYEEVRGLIEKLGGMVLAELLSRADLCLDISQLPAAELQQLVESRQFITRLKSVVPHSELVGDKQTGFTVGKRPQRLICYDKRNQLVGTCDALYARKWIETRHGGEDPGVASRIEGQFCRPFLKSFDINTPADLKAKGTALLQRFMTDQFRIVDRSIRKGDRNHGRAKTIPVWDDLVESVVHVFGPNAGPLQRVDRKKVDPIRLLKQGSGCYRNSLLQQGVELHSFDDLKESLWAQFQRLHPTEEDRQAFLEDYRRRQSEYRG